METTLEDLINIDLIAVEIVKKLEKKDLLNCALLNKQWNNLTRDHLYRTENLSIELEIVEKYRDTNLDRLHWLQNSEQKLFKQLNLRTDTFLHSCDNYLWPLLSQLRQAPILAPGITSVKVSDHFYHKNKCEATEILKCFLESLPENSIKNLKVGNVVGFQSIFVRNDQFIFPQLQTISFKFNNHLDKLSLIPSLKEYSKEVSTRELGIILEQGKSHLIKYLVLHDLPDSKGSEMDILLKFAEQQPQLKELRISDTQIRDLILNRNEGLTIFFQSILASSYLSLEKIHCKIDFRVLSTISQICDKSFPGVKSFLFPQQQIFEAEILGSICLSKLFPNLSTVIVSHVEDLKMDTDVLEVSRDVKGSMTCASVKNLIFSGFPHPYRSEYNDIFARIFPNVRNLKYEFFKNESELVSICRSVWHGIWKQLENLSITLLPDQLSKCEWSFLGVSEPEWIFWKELKKKGVNLKTMQFVPSDFSLANFTSTHIWLKIFRSSNQCTLYPTELLELIEVEPDLFRLSSRVDLPVEPENISSLDTVEPPMASGLFGGIHNQLLWFKNWMTSKIASQKHPVQSSSEVPDLDHKMERFIDAFNIIT